MINKAADTTLTITLTTGPDSFTGTSNNDTFSGSVDYAGGQLVGAASTFTSADTLAGGSGTDTANIVLTNAAGGAVALPVANLSGIEVYNLRNVSGQQLNVDAAQFSGETQVNADRSSSAVAVTGLADGASAGMIGNGSVQNGNFSFGYATAAAAATLNVSGGTTGGNVAITSAPTAVTINSTGAANTIGTVALNGAATGLTVNAASSLTTAGVAGFTGTSAAITVSGAATNVAATATAAATGSVVLGTLENTTVKTLDASGLTAGGVDAVLNTNVALAVTGGAGNDTFTSGSVLTTGSVNAGGGAGDRLIVANSAHLASATLGAKYTNFEVLRVNNNVSVDLDNISGISAVEISDGGNTTAATDLSSTQAAAVTLLSLNGAATIGVKNASTVGQLDTVNITVSNGNTTTSEDITDVGDLTISDVETINFNAVDDLELATIANMNEVTSSTITGAGDVGIYMGSTAVALNTSFNASGSTGTVKLSAAQVGTNGVALTTGSKAGQLIGSAQADVLTGGAGNDVLLGGGGADTLSGGDGDDVIDGGDGADTMTGGAGSDDFGVTIGGATTVDRITDLVLGTDDIIVTVAPGTVLSTVTAAVGANLEVAANSIQGTIGANTAGIFTYDSKSYLWVNDATASVGAGDIIVDITGYTGTLAAGDFVTTGATLTTTANGTETVFGTAGADTITGGAGNDTITGGAGNDTITGGAGADILVFLSTAALNGTDTIVDFTLADDQIDLAVTLTDLRGDGNVAQRGGGGAALNADAGLFISSADIADAAAAEVFAENLTGENANDVIFLLGSTDADAGTGVTSLYRVEYAGAGDASVTVLGTFNAFELDNLAPGNLVDYGAIV